ncbi:hypothetical protein NQ317_016727 [Molorchus minor]|uniref:Uncharacterized protein n=1 Tax=Molorchus minor TaxID=1323400 RepID=A0ABQ9IYD0_9CUCU|nr:hypothetical protein NQ317_016727 [Molorchus minor]
MVYCSVNSLEPIQYKSVVIERTWIFEFCPPTSLISGAAVPAASIPTPYSKIEVLGPNAETKISNYATVTKIVMDYNTTLAELLRLNLHECEEEVKKYSR